MKIEDLERILHDKNLTVAQKYKFYTRLMPCFIDLYKEAKKMRKAMYNATSRPDIDSIFLELDAMPIIKRTDPKEDIKE